MQKYDHTALFVPEGKNVVDEIYSMGQAGWRLVGNPEIAREEVNGKVETTAVAWFWRESQEEEEEKGE